MYPHLAFKLRDCRGTPPPPQFLYVHMYAVSYVSILQLLKVILCEQCMKTQKTTTRDELPLDRKAGALCVCGRHGLRGKARPKSFVYQQQPLPRGFTNTDSAEN
jgi:hypothetical protein